MDILPSQCLEACTAVGIEISHGPKLDVQVTFVTQQEWEDDMKMVHEDLRDLYHPDNSDVLHDRDIKAEEIVSAKMKLMYPFLREKAPHKIAEMDLQTILEKPYTFQTYLGNKDLSIQWHNTEDFKDTIYKYCAAGDFNGTGSPIWPIIKSMKIQCNSDSLESGAVIIDLPGMGDMNAARANARHQYLDRCDCIWVATLIRRAVDNKGTDSLIDESLLRQLRFVACSTLIPNVTVDGRLSSSSLVIIATQKDLLKSEDMEGYLRDDPEFVKHKQAVKQVEDKLKKMKQSRVPQKRKSDTTSATTKKLKTSENTAQPVKAEDTHDLPAPDEKTLLIDELTQLKDKMNEYCLNMGFQILKTKLQDKIHRKIARFDHSNLNIPIFCCSAQNYTSLIMTFDTGIPDLKKFCQEKSLASWQHATHQTVVELQTILADILNWLKNSNSITESDKEAMRKLWRPAGNKTLIRRYNLHITYKIEEMLQKQFNTAVIDLEVSMKKVFYENLDEDFKRGAELACLSALKTVDRICSELPHWQSFRAMLRRQGIHKVNVNEELVNPLIKQIVTSWAATFKTNLFSPFKDTVTLELQKVLQEVQKSAGNSLQKRCISHVNLSSSTSETAINSLVDKVKMVCTQQQRRISRSIIPFIQEKLSDGYAIALEEEGRGSGKTQKMVFRQFVNDYKDGIFIEGSKTILQELDAIATSVGKVASEQLYEVAKKVEANLSAIWQTPPESEETKQALVIIQKAQKELEEMMDSIQDWEKALE
ncbi:hypothetical protein C8Q75DRAFT_357215 [Abortiporus biennis]|nr:hypothetical protein C8Q75DRAFT_357215 [Abortiporus biennis]